MGVLELLGLAIQERTSKTQISMEKKLYSVAKLNSKAKAL